MNTTFGIGPLLIALGAQSFSIPDEFPLTLKLELTKQPTIGQLMLDSASLEAQTQLEAQKAQKRWSHAQELLGDQYSKSIVSSGERIASVDEVLVRWTRKALKGKWKNSSLTIAETILGESEKRGLDPFFIFSVIQNESSFNPEALGKVGEIGLMQLIPTTAEWVAKKFSLPWSGIQSLKDPLVNIQLGVAYISYLREYFDFQSDLYISAYNMGSTKVIRAVENQSPPRRYAARIMKQYFRYYSQLMKEFA